MAKARNPHNNAGEAWLIDTRGHIPLRNIMHCYFLPNYHNHDLRIDHLQVVHHSALTIITNNSIVELITLRTVC